MNVVLDKSYLQGASKDEIHQLCSQYQLIMPEVLFLEILTTKKRDMVNCFKKFPEIENPVSLVNGVGSLISFETKNRRSCLPIETQFLKIPYKFNERLAKNKFAFSREQKDTLKEWEENVSDDTILFIKKAILSNGWFPELCDYMPGKPADSINYAMNKVATDFAFVRKLYSQLREEIYRMHKELWPDPKIIDKQWVLFRYLQVHLLAALEYIKKYGMKTPALIPKDFQNEYLDIAYCITGTLADGLATRDKTMEKFYRLLCPNKVIIS